MIQIDIFNKKRNNDWVIFHDESFCEQTNFLYHGFLFIKKEFGKILLKKMNNLYPENYTKRIHFTELTGLNSRRSKIALEWLREFKSSWVKNDNLKFYCLGVNLDNINYDLYKSSRQFVTVLPSKNDRVYRRFYEIGLKGSLAWFEIDRDNVGHLFFDQGKQDIDRFNKSLDLLGNETIIKPLNNKVNDSGMEISKLLQLNDVILGVTRKLFSPPPKSKTAQIKCIDIMENLIEQFSDSKKAYNKNSSYFKNFCISFFPRNSDITPEEFFNQSISYFQKSKDLFYCDRKTYNQKLAEKNQEKLFDST